MRRTLQTHEAHVVHLERRPGEARPAVVAQVLVPDVTSGQGLVEELDDLGQVGEPGVGGELGGEALHEFLRAPVDHLLLHDPCLGNVVTGGHDEDGLA